MTSLEKEREGGIQTAGIYVRMELNVKAGLLFFTHSQSCCSSRVFRAMKCALPFSSAGLLLCARTMASSFQVHSVSVCRLPASSVQAAQAEDV
jgi:hypothetical protein